MDVTCYRIKDTNKNKYFTVKRGFTIWADPKRGIGTLYSKKHYAIQRFETLKSQFKAWGMDPEDLCVEVVELVVRATIK